MGLDHTHDPAQRSWVRSANGHPEFPIQNLPYGVFRRGSRGHVGVAIGDEILDLTALEGAGELALADAAFFADGTLNPFMAAGPGMWHRARTMLFGMLQAGAERLSDQFLVPQDQTQMELPFFVRSFTDFYASRAHATNVGAMFRDPEKALMPNWLHLPVGYNGRASSVVVSGTEIVRPMGQTLAAGSQVPAYAASQRLDLEVELGAVVGTGTAMGARLTPEAADASIFGYVLLNDWSARDLQVWEYQPLGPFLSKAFATTISPWVVTTEALKPFRAALPAREHPLLPYLATQALQNFDITIEAHLTAPGSVPTRVCRTNAKHLYYAPAQMLTHQASSGAPICTGDLLGSGTISGPDAESLGSLLEVTKNGRTPLRLPDGDERCFLEDGDKVTLTGACSGPYRIGFGTCEGTVQPAVPV